MKKRRCFTRAALALSLFAAAALSANAQTQVVYDDFTENGWANYSYGGNSDFASTVIVPHGGTKSIQFTPTADRSSAVSFVIPFALGDTSTATYPVLSFWINGGPTGAQPLGIVLARSDTAAENEIDLATGTIPPPTANTWTQVTINLTQLTPAYNGTFDRIDIHGTSAASQQVLYIDDVQLTQGVAPPPMNPITITQDQQAPAGAEQMLSDIIAWFDGSGKQRQVTLAHDNTPHAYAGTGTIYGYAMREYQYQLSDLTTRVAGVTTYPGNGSHGGFGYVVNHSNAGSCVADDSPLGDFFPYGTFTRVPFTGGHHAIYRFTQNYPRNCPNYARTIPVTIEWVFSTGRDHPLYAITYDVDLVKRTSDNAIAPVNTLFDDTRAPYGELNIDGDGYTEIDGVAWGDKFKFTSTTAPVSLSSEWTYNVANTVPYVKEWLAGPLTGDHKKDATMGLVQTQTIAQQDAGARNRYYHNLTVNWNKTSAQQLGCDYGDVGPYKMPCPNEFAFQANADNLGVDDPMTVAVEGASNNSRLTWGTAYGFLGQQNYDADDEFPIDNPGAATYPPGYPKKSYSLFVVLGQHTSSPVESQVTQIETIQSLNLTINGGVGSVVTTGPAGVTRADTITYNPPGYNHVYSALAFNTNGSNQLDANIAVGAGTLTHPLIIVGNYTNANPPTQIVFGGVTLNGGTDFFASIRTDTNPHQLWLTLNRNLSGAMNRLQINASACTPAASAPTGVVATVMSQTSVALSWTPVCNADSYIVEREGRTTDNFNVQAGTPQQPMLLNNGLTAKTAYRYRVRAVQNAVEGPNSAVVLATTVVFTDPNLSGVPAKVTHLTELRDAVSAVHYLYLGTTVPTWPTDNTVTNTTKIKGQHILDIRTKLDEALGAGAYTDGTLDSTVRIKAVHVQEIRTRVN